MTMSSIIALAIFVAAFALIATEKINKVIVVLVASAAMVVTGVAPANDIFYSHKVGVDWDVILLLLGMMIVVGVLKQTGIFEYLGIWAGKKSKGRPYRLMVMFMLITAIASPILDNVTIILLVVPVTVVVCNRLHVAAQPYIIAEILASNIGGAATLIGDPPNIIIGNRAGLSFNDFLVHMLPIVALTFALFVVLTRFLFRKEFDYNPEYADSVMTLQERRAITDRALLIKCLTVLTLIIAGFTLHNVLHVQPAIIALIGALVMVLVTGVDVEEVLAEVAWGTLVFFAGLFIMVGALVNTGIIESIGQWAIGAVGHDYTLAGAHCCSARPWWAPSSTTFRTPPRWPRSSTSWSMRDPIRATVGSCGGPSPWAPTSAATGRRWRPVRTSSASGWPTGRATGSRSGGSRSTASSRRSSRRSSPGSTSTSGTSCWPRRGMDKTGKTGKDRERREEVASQACSSGRPRSSTPIRA